MIAIFKTHLFASAAPSPATQSDSVVEIASSHWLARALVPVQVSVATTGVSAQAVVSSSVTVFGEATRVEVQPSTTAARRGAQQAFTPLP